MEAQSKGGECQLNKHPADAVPIAVAVDLTIWKRCKCGKAYKVKPPAPSFAKVEIEEAEKTVGEESRERWDALK